MESKMHQFMQFSTFLEFDITSLEGRIKVLCVFNRESIKEYLASELQCGIAEG